MKIKNYINEFLSENRISDPDKLRKIRYMKIFMLASPAFFIPNILKWINIGVPALAISMFAVMVIMLLSLFLLRMTANIFLSANISFAALSWHFILLPCLTGGIESSGLSWNLIIPMLAVLFVGIRSAMFWTLFMLAEIIILWWLKKIGYELPSVVLTPEQLLGTYLANNIGPLLAVTLTLHFVEQGAQDMLISQQAALLDRKKALLNIKKADAESRQLLAHFDHIVEKAKKHTEHLTSDILKNMASVTRENVRYADQSSTFMQESDQVVTRTNAIVGKLGASMEDVAISGREMSKLLKNINTIAFQTHLLALNAAVEAAKAGEAGAGFSVVASEIKNLANQVAESANDTQKFISDILGKIDSGSDMAISTGAAFSELTGNMEKVIEFIDNISKTSYEQARVIEQTSEIVRQVDQILMQDMALLPDEPMS